MHAAHDFLKLLATVLCVAAFTTVLFQRLRQPVVLGYMLAGLIVGPYVPIPLSADRTTVQTLSEIGVILLMFSLGLEFRLRELARVGPSAGLTAIVQCSIMLWLGFVTARALGWSVQAGVFAGAIIAISSTTIIAKAFDEQGISGKLREFVVGVLIVEDLVAILLLAALTTMTTTAGLSALALTRAGARLLAFLVGVLLLGLLLVPRTIRAITRLERPETTLVASIGICFAIALLALEFGYSVALGAFLAGSLVAESGEAKKIEHLVEPVRDMFGAIFFVSVGMSIDPHVIAAHWAAVCLFSTVVIVGKVVAVTAGAFLTGAGTRLSLSAGMSLAQIGEFSFIIAGLASSLQPGFALLYPLAVAVSAITTLTTPFLIRAASPFASFVDRKLPHRLQTFAALYGGWVERLAKVPRADATRNTLKRLVAHLVLDVLLLGLIVVAMALYADPAIASLAQRLGRRMPARLIVVGAALALALPLCVGVVRVTRHIGMTLGEAALPKDAQNDIVAAPRRALAITLQLAIVLLLGTPLLALTQPFLRGPEGAIVLGLALSAFGYSVWRSARQLQGHVRGGAEMIANALSAEHEPSDEPAPRPMNELLASLGEPAAVKLERHSAAAGATLADLDLRGLTGATVLAIMRGEGGVVVPTAREPLLEGDVLVLAGTREAVEHAKRLLGARA